MAFSEVQTSEAGAEQVSPKPDFNLMSLQGLVPATCQGQHTEKAGETLQTKVVEVTLSYSSFVFSDVLFQIHFSESQNR